MDENKKCVKNMDKIKITQVKSSIKRPYDQKRTLQALGLKKLNHSVEVVLTPQIKGMIEKVKHLVKIEEM